MGNLRNISALIFWSFHCLFMTNYINVKTNFTSTSTYSGIYRDKTMANTLMYNPNVDIQNYPFCRFQLVVEMFSTQRNEPIH